MQCLGSFAHLLLFLVAFSADTVAGSCDPKAAEIIGGNYTLLEDGTTLIYECPQGQYPHPTQFRFCKDDNHWSPLKGRDGGIVEQAVCQAVRCVKPVEFENGAVENLQKFYDINQELRFTCYNGYTLRGSQIRTCLPNGKWSGETAMCDDGTSHCPNPGIPIGALKFGTEYQAERKVRYQCLRGLSLIGSKERVCQISRTWSGSEPECRSPFTFDSKEEIKTKFLPSLAEVALSASQGASANNKSDQLNIYFVLDASESFGRTRFTKAKEALVKLIEKISSYDFLPNYGIVTFATDSRIVLGTTDSQSSDADWVSHLLSTISTDVHELKPGSNIRCGFQAVYEMMITQDLEEKRRGLNPTPVSTTVHHVIIFLTDGNYNLGGFPSVFITQIKEFLNIGRRSPKPHDDHLGSYHVGNSSSPDFLQINLGRSSQNSREDYLDIYVFGNGQNINIEVINELASHKPSERHSFILKDLAELKEIFQESLDDGESMPVCGFSPGEAAADDYEKNPWFARIVINETQQEICKGVIVSDRYILTAAHCLARVNGIEDISVILGTTNFAVAEIQHHPDYNSQNVQNKDTPEMYDFDAALVKLKRDLPSFARPVCLPCTIETTRILRKPHPQTTCKDHEKELLYAGNIPSLFITTCKKSNGQKTGLVRRDVLIKNGEKKIDCYVDAEKARQYENVTNILEVNEHFLCTGGTDPQVDPNICSRDAGGPLLIQRRLRYIQLGVISWSVVDTCKGDRSLLCGSKPVNELSSHARDFHTNIFKILPWLKEQLRTEVEFL
ncbi:complement factor B-like isoform 2-T2 [Vipera latastei]